VCLGVAIVILCLAGGLWLFLEDQRSRKTERFAQQMVGNWDMVAGQTQLETWVLAFHADGRFQMQTSPTDVSNGRWKVLGVRDDVGSVRVEWPDDAPEVMSVRFDSSSLMHLQLPSLGDFTFRPAATLPSS